jgi:hypothetical protein
MYNGYENIQGHFVMECHSGSYFSEGCKAEQHFEIFFLGIGVTNTTPVQPNFESPFAFWNPFQKEY